MKVKKERSFVKGASIKKSVTLFFHQAKANRKPQILDTEMETSLLLQARFLLDSKANWTATQKIPGICLSVLCISYVN